MGIDGMIGTNPGAVLVPATFGLVGAGFGAATRLLLSRLQRGAPIPVGCCEALLAALWCTAGTGWALELLPIRALPLLLGLAWLAVAAGSVDQVRLRLPNVLTLPAVPVALLLLTPLGVAAVGRGLAGAVVAASVYGSVHLVAPAAVGAGDVKLAGSLGAALAGVSWLATFLAAVLAAVLTGAVALVKVARSAVAAARPPPRGRAARSRESRPAAGSERQRGIATAGIRGVVPHGPSMLAATWVVLIGLLVGGAPLGVTGGG
jgi:leader peptidase (prepilin peptidase) / N-methyltransferase